MLNAAIIGCGNIAGFLDSPLDKYITTHAHAYMKHPETRLIAVCDPDIAQREKFIQRWGEDIRTYDTLNDLLAHESIDILSICSPTPFHANALKTALTDKHISHILCEKPFVQTQEELDDLKPLLEQSNKKVLINFIRRYDPSIQVLNDILHSGDMGSILHFNGNFTKGLYHNGSHMLELLEHLCGKIRSIHANKLSLDKEDLYGSFYLETEQTHGSLHNESGDNYALFELELTLSKGRIKIRNSGHLIEIETIEPSKEYPGYFRLDLSQTLDDTMQKNLYNALSYLLKTPNSDDLLQEHIELSQKLLTIKEHLDKTHFLEFT